MIERTKGIVKDVNKIDDDICVLTVDVNGHVEKAINYSKMTGNVKCNDVVLLNTTAVSLGLGSGGYHFVIANYNNTEEKLRGKGHIMKLRYTPIQLKVLSVEEQQSQYHDIFEKFKSLNGMPVIIGELHSMLSPLAVSLKYLYNGIRLSYIMTDSAALPIVFSNSVRKLKEDKILDKTITIGNAYGGDYEAINIYTGLITSSIIAKSDVTIVMMGPGIAGTGTKYGFSGIDQGFVIDAVNKLGGVPIFIPRIQFNDPRDRHKGLSHHTVTVLKDITNSRCRVIIPYMKDSKMNYIKKQLTENQIDKKHDIIYMDGCFLKEANKNNYNFSTMGRKYEDEPDFFNTCAAAARYVYENILR